MKNIKKYLMFCITFLVISIIKIENTYAMGTLPVQLSSLPTLPLSQQVGDHYEYEIPESLEVGPYKVELDYESDGINIKLQSTIGSANKQNKYITNNIKNVTWYVFINENDQIGVFFMEGRTSSTPYKIYVEISNDTCPSGYKTIECNQIIGTELAEDSLLYGDYIYNPNSTYMSNFDWSAFGMYLITDIEGSWIWHNRYAPDRKIYIIGSNVPTIVSDRVPAPVENMYRQQWGTYASSIHGIYNFNDKNTKYNKYTDKQVESIDIYTNKNQTTDNISIDITSQDYNQNLFYPTAYKFYGEKCNGNTCYWEEIQNGIDITNDTYTDITNGLSINFDLSINTSGYNKIKIGIKTLAKNFNAKLRRTNINNSYDFDLNPIGINYSFKKYRQDQNEKYILVQSKNNQNIFYRFYEKRNNVYNNITFYKTIQEQFEVKESIPTNVYNDGQGWLETGTIQLNNTQKLYILLERYGTQNTILASEYQIYYSTDVIYTESYIKSKFVINENGIESTENYNITNSYINSTEGNNTEVNFDSFIDMIKEYKQYKDDWLQLFNTIWGNIPEAIRTLIIIIYFLAHCIGIYIIFKD